MDMTEKNGQPSMEEILASIRRIVAEEPETQMISHAPANAPVIDFRNNPITLNGDGVLDDTSEFDLPAIFRSSSTPAPEKPGQLIGRLTDAIRNATQSEPKPQAEVRQAQSQAADEGADAARFGVSQSESYQALSSLKPTRYETPAAEPAKDSKPAGQSWNFARSSPPPAAINDEIKRVMTPFKDTHFLRMAGPAPEVPDVPAPPVPASPVPVAAAPAAPAPVAESARPRPGSPAASAPARVVDFGAIIPGQFDRPGNGAADADRRPAAPQPATFGQPSREEAPEREASAPPAIPAESLTPPPLSLVSSESPDVAAAPSPAPVDGTIEDTTAELLRPMLRQWLAENMPRMVEKALHIEVAESVRTGKKPTGL